MKIAIGLSVMRYAHSEGLTQIIRISQILLYGEVIRYALAAITEFLRNSQGIGNQLACYLKCRAAGPCEWRWQYIDENKY
ncbi:MAG: hypothetical protein PWP64_1362 [Candidatus Cloacimonadota bacterium]|nr:hypothetical protein [Candidatus Cloacimonadota bacterium]